MTSKSKKKSEPASFTFDAIGVVRSPFVERVDAPRQPSATSGASATIELFEGRGFEDALADLEGWSHVWIVFVFHMNAYDPHAHAHARGWKPKVLPPRSTEKRGVFATRSPHRPNPIGISLLRLDAVDAKARVLRVSNVDVVDGTPVLDLKPWVAYADAYPSADEIRHGWLDTTRDPTPAFEVAWSDRAGEEIAWLKARGVDLRARIADALALGPQPHAYRRIRDEADGTRTLAIKEWRARFRVEGSRVEVLAIRSGYRQKQLHEDPALAVHREFVARFR